MDLTPDGDGCGPAAPSGLGAGEAEALAVVLKAVADPVRLRLFAVIAASDASVCVCHLPAVGVAQPTVSHHLRRLREAGLIESERRGTWVHYSATKRGRALAVALGSLTPPT